MFQIAKKPYIKTYKFPTFSEATIFQCILYTLAIILPFFMVYSVTNFYQTFSDTIQISPTIAYNYTYYIQIQTDASLYTLTNFYEQRSRSKGLHLEYQFNEKLGVHKFELEWPKLTEEKVREIKIILGYTYSTAEYSYAFGLVGSEAKGINMGDVSIFGTINIMNGGNKNANPPTTSILTDNEYDFAQTQISLEKNYAAFLSSQYEPLISNLPTNNLKISLQYSAAQYFVKEQDPSILGQFIWSFAQYFPIALIFCLIATSILRIVFKQNILRSVIIHEKIPYKM